MKRVGKEVCQERKRVRSQTPELSTRKGPSRFRDYKRKPDGEKVASSENEIKKEKLGRKRRPDKQQATGRPVKSQESEMSGASRIKRKWHHQTRCRGKRHVKVAEKISRADAVNGRDSQCGQASFL